VDSTDTGRVDWLPMKALTALRLLWRDLRRTARGSAAFWRYLVSKETVEVGLGVFSTESSHVVKGQPCHYFVRIANVSPEVQVISLIIDIHAAEVAPGQDGYYAYFTKHLKVEPRTAIAVEMHYDWLAKASFTLTGVPSPPDEFRVRGGSGPQWYAVTALLLGPLGARLDALSILQELQE
jgi:hypothetical protein